MRVDRIKNTGRNAIWGIISKLFFLGIPFVIRTIILYKLGAGYLGLSSLFVSILQVLNLSELGFSTAIVYSLYKPIAEDDAETICAILAYYKRAYRIIGITISSIGILLIPWLPQLIKGSVPDGLNIYVLYLIYLFDVSISYYLFSYKSCLLAAHQRNDIISKRNLNVKMLLYICQIIVLILLKSYYFYIFLIPIFTIIYNILISHTVTKNYPQYTANGKLSPCLVKRLKKQISGLMIIKIAATTRNSFDSIVLSSAIGLVSVALYGNYYYIISSVQGIILILLTSMQAGIGNSIAMDSREKNTSDFRKFVFAYSWISVFCTVCLFFFYQPFMKFWAGSEHLLSFDIVCCFCIYFYLLSMGDVPNIYINATGIWWNFRLRSFVEAFSNLILNMVFVHFWGIIGVLIATIITRLIFGVIWGNFILFKAYFGLKKIRIFFEDHVLYIFITILSCGLIYLGDRLTNVSFFEVSILKVLLCLCVPNILFFLFFHRTERYKSFHPIIKSLIQCIIKT